MFPVFVIVILGFGLIIRGFCSVRSERGVIFRYSGVLCGIVRNLLLALCLFTMYWIVSVIRIEEFYVTIIVM